MSDYDYGNARLRAMKSRLLTRREFEVMAEMDNLESMISMLSRTAYRRPVETALARSTGLACITDALHLDLIETVEKIHSFYPQQDDEMATIIFRQYDLDNLKAILRGLSKHATSAEIISTLIPVGALSYWTLIELAGAPGPRAAIDVMASMGLPYARPLLHLRAERPGAEVFEMELALARWHQRTARDELKNASDGGEPLLSALNREADMANLLTILRFIHSPAEYRYLRQQIGSEDLSNLFIGPGFLQYTLLTRAASQESLPAAIQIFAGTRYEAELQDGLAQFTASGRLSDIERSLRMHDLVWRTKLITKDPLGIGVLIGYLALKTNEISNIRRIAYEIQTGWKADAIRSTLEFAE